MLQKNSLSAIATFIAIVALTITFPGVSRSTQLDATAAAYSSIPRDQSPGVVIAENEQSDARADSDSDRDSDSKDSDDATADDDQEDGNDQTDQQSAGNEQVAPQIQNGDNDGADTGGEAEQAPMNAYPQQVNPYQ